MPSVYLKTYGCQMNERDSEHVAAHLVAKGYTLAASAAMADVILLNTCSVRDFAERKALNKMTNLVAATRRRRPAVVLGFLGCMAQSRGQALVERLPDVDLILGTQKFHRVADYLDDVLAGRRDKVVDVAEEPGSEATIREHLLGGNGRRTVTAFVSIMQGCNQHCTFCIVPQTRGAERSRSIADIVAECRQLVAQGVKEITLLGQTVTSYGSSASPASGGSRREEAHASLQGQRPSLLTSVATIRGVGAEDRMTSFVQLLEAIHEIEGLERIRFTAPHPKGYGDDLVQAYGRLPKLVESAHLPVQSGSNRVLKLMRRGYTRDRYLRLIEKLRRVQPGMGLCTDFIVGFPGETEDDFEQTLSLTREVEFDQAFIFKYSPRRDTPAVGMPEPVPQAVREERHQRLLQLVNEIGRRKYAAFVGRRVEILVEGPSKKNPARLMGRTRCNKIVVFEGSARHRGQLLDVRITRAGTFTLYGDPAMTACSRGRESAPFLAGGL